MALSSSQLAPMNVKYGKSLYINPKIIDIKEDLKLTVEQIVDFDSFNLNGYPIWNFFKVEEWDSLFDMLNEPTYPHMVKDLWVRSEVYDEFASSTEEN